MINRQDAVKQVCKISVFTAFILGGRRGHNWFSAHSDYLEWGVVAVYVESQQALETLVYLAYIDDSDFTAKKDQPKSAPEQFQVLAGILLRDSLFSALEAQFSLHGLACTSIYEFPADFEFHAMDLFRGDGFWKDNDQTRRFFVFERCVTVIRDLKIPIVYGAVDKAKLAKQIYKSANPLDISFRLCVQEVQKVLQARGELGLLIADNFDEGKKRNLKQVFRDNRRKFVFEAIDMMSQHSSKSAAMGGNAPAQKIEQSNLLDDMYFGDSKDSVGIQAADMCAFLIRRHLAGKQDSEWLYKIIEPQISGNCWPE